MFWNKNEKYNSEPTRQDHLYDHLTTYVKCQDKKINLILDHLKLKYVLETETKEPAKLVEKTVAYTPLSNLENGAIIRCPDGTGFSFTTTSPTGPTPTKTKKKGRPKKK